jgi:hypothetical protein
MKMIFSCLLVAGVFSLISGSDSVSGENGRYLILNFDCHGQAAGKSDVLGDSLRSHVKKQGGSLVSRDLFEKLLEQKGLHESDLNYTIENLKSLMPMLNASCAVYGHIFSSKGIFTVELRYLESADAEPILFDPIVCGDLKDIYAVIPEMARLVLLPDKIPPHVVSIVPEDGETQVAQYVEMVIEFSEPMNPVTSSIYGKPEGMWMQYGDILYDEELNTFVINMHLYPDITYEFHINGDNSKGFKDLAGNPSKEHVWTFSTGR